MVFPQKFRDPFWYLGQTFVGVVFFLPFFFSVATVSMWIHEGGVHNLALMGALYVLVLFGAMKTYAIMEQIRAGGS